MKKDLLQDFRSRLKEMIGDVQQEIIQEISNPGRVSAYTERLFNWRKVLGDLVECPEEDLWGLFKDPDQSSDSEITEPVIKQEAHEPVPVQQGPPKKYPEFYIETQKNKDFLLKIGKKKKGLYRNRVPKGVVNQVIAGLLASNLKKDVFHSRQLQALFPNDKYPEIKTYQPHICLQLLEHFGLANRKGKQGYTVSGFKLEQFEQKLAELPRKKRKQAWAILVDDLAALFGTNPLDS